MAVFLCERGCCRFNMLAIDNLAVFRCIKAAYAAHLYIVCSEDDLPDLAGCPIRKLLFHHFHLFAPDATPFREPFIDTISGGCLCMPGGREIELRISGVRKEEIMTKDFIADTYLYLVTF